MKVPHCLSTKIELASYLTSCPPFQWPLLSFCGCPQSEHSSFPGTASGIPLLLSAHQ